MQVTLVNDDPFGNNVRVIDRNAGNAEIFNGYIAAHGEQILYPRQNDSGYGNITTYQDGNPSGIQRSLLNDGERISL